MTTHQALCEDCRQVPAVRVFLHLSGCEYDLCDECFALADHEDNYLHCHCEFPEGEPGDTNCNLCHGSMPYYQDVCRCAHPTTTGYKRIRCRTCRNGIRHGVLRPICWCLFAGPGPLDECPRCKGMIPTLETAAGNPPPTPETPACSIGPNDSAPQPLSDPTSPRASHDAV